ncbi:MAG: flagellar hook-length control protein FliK [Limnobacter sp.]|nr:flagellar hook-length control protein FliK [Limnobacter sp.]
MSLTPLKGSNTNPPSVNSLLQANPGDRISADKSEVSPIVAVLSRQLPLPQAQQLNGQTALVKVLKNGTGGQAELEFNGQKIAVKMPPGRSLTAGEMITVSFALNEKDGLGAAGGSSGAKKTADVNRLLQTAEKGDSSDSESPSFVDKLSSSARMIGLLERVNEGKTIPLGASVKNMAELMVQAKAEQQSKAAAIPMPSPSGSSPAAGTAGAQASNQAAAAAGNAATGATSAQTAAVEGEASSPAMLAADLSANNTAGGKGPSSSAANQALTTASNANNTLAVNFNKAVDSGLTGLLAQEVSSAVENSGLFYENHLQQWANGQRSKDQLTLEPQARFGAEQVISEKAINPDAINQSVKLVSSQLAALDHSRIAVSMQGLFDKPVNVEIEPDQRQPDDPPEEGEQARPWVAKLKLDMAHLGEIHVKLRMVGNRCDILLSGSRNTKSAIDPHWTDIQEALRDKGLQLAHGTIRTREDTGHG